MASCYICKKHVTTGLVVCQECARGQAGTRFAQMTATPESLAAWLDKIYNIRGNYSFCNEYCKSDCEDTEDCQHELECIEKWLNERVGEPNMQEIKMQDMEAVIAMHHQLTDGLDGEAFARYRKVILIALEEKIERDKITYENCKYTRVGEDNYSGSVVKTKISEKQVNQIFPYF